MKIRSFAIIGAGALGSYYGARLAQHGHEVHFLVRSDAAVLRREGLKVRSHAGDFTLAPDRLRLYEKPEAMPKVDLVIVSLKTTSNSLFEPLIRPLLGDNTAILTLQNGLGNEEALATLFGEQRILGGVAFTCINRTAPGCIDHTSHGHIRLGEFIGGPSDRSAEIAELFLASKIPCDVVPDLRYARWEKLVWNFPFNGLSAVLDQTTDLLLNTEPGEKLVRDLMAETIASARANGVDLPDSLIDLNISRTREMGAYRTSMHIDRQARRDLEVEAILGRPTRVGTAAGVNNFRMQTLYDLACMIRMQIVYQAGVKADYRV